MRLTFKYLAKVARDHGFVFEQNGNSRYVLFSNKLAPGIESEYSSIAEAWDDLYYLERACEVQRLALATGRPLKIVAPDVAQRTYAQMMGEGRESAALHLQSIKRVLDREQPEYRT